MASQELPRVSSASSTVVHEILSSDGVGSSGGDVVDSDLKCLGSTFLLSMSSRKPIMMTTDI